jgi:hypothetical protein
LSCQVYLPINKKQKTPQHEDFFYVSQKNMERFRTDGHTQGGGGCRSETFLSGLEDIFYVRGVIKSKIKPESANMFSIFHF